MSDTKPSTPEYRAISSLHNWENNPRTATKDGIERLIKQIKKLGVYKPLLITEDGTVLGGNMRLKALEQMGEKKVWVSVVQADTEEKKIEYALSDNDRVGKYEGDQLANLIGNFPEVEWGDYSVDIKEPELVSDLMDSFKEVEEDEAPAVEMGPAESKLGEVYQLGRHRVMCGDSTVKENVEMLMNGDKADMVFTDPPYNFEGEGAGFLKSSTANMRDRVKDIIDFEPNSIDFIKDLDVHSFLFFCNKALIPMYLDIFKGYTFDVLVWHKTNPTPFTSNGFLPDIEYLLMFTRKGRVWNNSLKPTSVYSKVYSSAKLEGREGAGDVHPTMKPIKLLADKMRVCSSKNGGVLDLFLGSGSTLIACEQTNRICYGMELDPHYVDVIRKRYDNFVKNRQITGK